MTDHLEANATGRSAFVSIVDDVVANVAQVLEGKEPVVRLALLAIAAQGHLLVEDVPGVGKTTLAKSLARSLDLQWHRIQFTPDLLPSDVTGASVYDRNSGVFTFRPGGIFANVVLGDEINRASPKTQSALLEAMEEHQVTVDGTTHVLPEPFLVVATQNPAEHEGTYPLPESQLDRFTLRVRMGYPDRDAEIAMLDRRRRAVVRVDDLPAVADAAAVARLVADAEDVHVAPALAGYLVDLAAATRRHPALALGMSPRSVLALQRTAQALAAYRERSYATPDDIRALAHPVLAHRLILSPGAAMSGTTTHDVLDEILGSVAVPAARSRS